VSQFFDDRTEAIAVLEQVVEEMHACMNEAGAALADYLLGACLMQAATTRELKPT